MAHNKFVQLLLFAILPHLASSQTVTLCVGELNGNVYVEWTGSLTALYQNPLEQTGITPQLSGNAFAFAALATDSYSYMTGSPFVTYSFVPPGIFSVTPDIVQGPAIGISAGTTIFLPLNYETVSFQITIVTYLFSLRSSCDIPPSPMKLISDNLSLYSPF